MSSLADHLERHSVSLVESTIPAHMTIDEWRRSRRSTLGAGDRRKRALRLPFVPRVRREPA
jgi:hypothetical protein